TKGSLFTLSNILAISPGHLDAVTGLFESLSQMKASEMKVFLQNIGWQSSDADTSLGKQSDPLDAIPDLSYIFPLNEGTLSEMSQVAKLSTSSITAGVEQMAESLRSDVSFYLKEARDFWKALPDYFNIASLLSLVNDPYISDIIRFLTFVYNNPSASFWELLLQYYKSIGMPANSINVIYAKQRIGNSSDCGIIRSNICTGQFTNADFHKDSTISLCRHRYFDFQAQDNTFGILICIIKRKSANDNCTCLLIFSAILI
ncbi:hypothetical protein LPJ57_007691, partial [Coemansia sp. RSA 486]